MEDPPSDVEPPEFAQVIALVPCERILTDASTGYRTLINVFDRFIFEDTPFDIPEISVLISIVRGMEPESRFYFAAISPLGQTIFKLPLDVTEWINMQADFEVTMPAFRMAQRGPIELRVYSSANTLASRLLQVT